MMVGKTRHNDKNEFGSVTSEFLNGQKKNRVGSYEIVEAHLFDVKQAFSTLTLGVCTTEDVEIWNYKD